MELGADFGVLVNDVAFFKNDVPEAKPDREAGCDFGCALVLLCFLFFGVLGIINTVFLGEVVQNT